ncbi:MAG: amidohydrolase family protein [Planctomycetota bacterium]
MIIRKGWIIPGDGAGSFEGDIRVSDGRIVEIAAHVAHRGEGEDEIDARGCVVIPGFVQAHSELSRSLFRGMSKPVDALTAAASSRWPQVEGLGEDERETSYRIGFHELIDNGVTCVLDAGVSHGVDLLFREAAACGIRFFGGLSMLDLDRTGRLDPALIKSRDECEALSKELAESFHESESGRLRYAAAPRFTLGCSDELLRSVSDLVCVNDWVLHLVASETESEEALVREHTKRSNVDYLSDMGVLGSQTILVHASRLGDEERNLLYGTGTHLGHCPSHSLAIGTGVAAAPELLDYGINLAFGVGAASRSSFLDELRLTGTLHNARLGNRGWPAEQRFDVATVGGAKALGIDDEVGTLEVGKKADIVIATLAADIRVANGGSLISTLVDACGPEQIRDVFVDGRALKRDYEVQTIDAAETLSRAQESWERLMKERSETA